MPLFIHPACIDIANEASWLINFQHAERPEIGYRLGLKTATNIRAMSTLEEGLAYAAYYPAYEPTAEGTLTNDTNAGTNRKYHHLDNDADYANWTIAAAGNGTNAVTVYYVSVVGGGTLQLVKNPAGAATVIGEVDTNAATNYLAETEVTLTASLATDDVLQFRRKTGTGTARLVYWRGYNTSSPATASTATYAVVSRTTLCPALSNYECAYNVGPTGETPKFCGGIAHQAAPYCSEVSPAVAWTKDGDALTPAAGYATGVIGMTRTSDVDYLDVGHTILGTLAYTYSFQQDYVTCQTVFTAGTNLALLSQYGGMLPTTTGVFTVSKTNGFYTTTLGAGDDSIVQVPAAQLTALQDCWMIRSPRGAKLHMDVTAKTHAFVQAFTMRRSDNIDKFYFDIKPAATAAATDAWGATWRLEMTARGPLPRHSNILMAPQRRIRKSY